MKKIILLLLLPLILSCDIQYDGETKLVVKGVVVDKDNQPFENQEINIFIYRSGSSGFMYGSSSETNHIGHTITKADGSYVMVIPMPKSNFTEISVEINSDDNLLIHKEFVNIQLNNFNNYELILPQTKLFNKVDVALLNVIPQHVTPNYDLQKIEYIGDIANEYEFMNTYEDTNLYDLYAYVKKNQTLVLKYTVLDWNTNEILVFEQNVLIGSENETNYILNY